ncbi:two-component system response regulator [Halalkalibacillus sediminis]|uniref:Two-component system response regulator n=1 Tax=Halalkalibacillus sediminis TaxID=2018042 RepID=A0A2I0QZ52_9BACI|nr:two-component system response regulator [Halalkalibacillus sediminis]
MYNVLLVDDSWFIRQWLKHILAQTGRYHVIAETSTGREALPLYNEHQPDIVILDVIMDGLDGFQTLSLMKRLFPSAKVIMCSSLAQKHVIQRCLDLGAKDFIEKPYFDDLIQKLDNVLVD